MNLFPNVLAVMCLYADFSDFELYIKLKSYMQKNAEMKADENQPYCDRHFKNHLIHSNLNTIFAFLSKVTQITI